MTSRDRRILVLLAESIRRRFPKARIWAFGSRVKGRHTKESDLDVCVVLEDLDEDLDRQVMRVAWSVGFEHGLVISTVTYSRAEFEDGPCAESPLVHTILEEGVAA